MLVRGTTLDRSWLHWTCEFSTSHAEVLQQLCQQHQYLVRFCRCSSLRRSLLNSVTAMVSWKHSNIVSTPRTGIYYLTMRLWIGLWASFFCMIIVAVDGSAIVRYFTRWDIGDSPKIDQIRFFCVRFTEEAFAALVGIIFIKESLSKLFSKFPGQR